MGEPGSACSQTKHLKPRKKKGHAKQARWGIDPEKLGIGEEKASSG